MNSLSHSEFQGDDAIDTVGAGGAIEESVFALVNSDPDVAIMVLSLNGRIEAYTANAPKVFGADETRDYQGLLLADVFDQQFADERLSWFREVIRENRPMRFQHLYQGDRMVSTIIPLDRESEPPLVSLLTRRERRESGNASRSQYLDIEPLEQLSPRELEVMVLIGHGFSVPETAKILHRSTRTIEQHKANLGRKLGGSSVAKISRLVGQFGLQIDDLELTRLQALRPEFRSDADPPRKTS